MAYVANNADNQNRAGPEGRNPDALADCVFGAEGMLGEIASITTTGSLPVRSCSLKNRPSRNGMPITVKKSGDTQDASAKGSWFGGGGVAVVQ